MPLTEYPKTFFADKPDAGAKLRTGTGLILQQEGLVNDLAFHVNRHRREMEYNVSDYIVLHLAVSLEVWWAIYFNESELLRKTLTTRIAFHDMFETGQEETYMNAELGDRENLFPVLIHSELHEGYVKPIY